MMTSNLRENASISKATATSVNRSNGLQRIRRLLKGLLHFRCLSPDCRMILLAPIRDKLPDLAVLVGGDNLAENKDKVLLNPYGVLAVDPGIS